MRDLLRDVRDELRYLRQELRHSMRASRAPAGADADELLTVEQVAAALQVVPPTARAWIQGLALPEVVALGTQPSPPDRHRRVLHRRRYSVALGGEHIPSYRLLFGNNAAIVHLDRSPPETPAQGASHAQPNGTQDPIEAGEVDGLHQVVLEPGLA